MLNEKQTEKYIFPTLFYPATAAPCTVLRQGKTSCEISHALKLNKNGCLIYIYTYMFNNKFNLNVLKTN